MNDFVTDIMRSDEMRRSLLSPSYEAFAAAGLVEAWRLSSGPYEQSRGDALFKLRDGTVIGIEDKIVRWPGYEYTAITLETDSCTLPGLEKPGWMVTAKYDWLIHVRVYEDEQGASCDAIRFEPLQKWWAKQDPNRYPIHEEREANKTRSRVVPLADIKGAVESHRFTTPPFPKQIFEFLLQKPAHIETHVCQVCGRSAGFGVGASMHRGIPGQWFCFAHRPGIPNLVGQEKVDTAR